MASRCAISEHSEARYSCDRPHGLEVDRISKLAQTYLRMLLIHGARSALRAAKSRAEPDRLQAWALEIEKRRGHNKAAVALANKMARLVWAVSTRGVSYQSQYVPA